MFNILGAVLCALLLSGYSRCQGNNPTCETFRSGEVTCRNVASMQELSSTMQANWRKLTIVNEKDTSFTNAEHPNPNIKFIEELDLSSAGGELIMSDHGFRDFSNLHAINVSNCQLKQLKFNWFTPNNNVKTLNASRNELTTLIGENFRTLGQLITLDLSINDIEEFENNSFEPMQLLEQLYLNKNRIYHLNRFGRLPGLTRLDLSDNSLRTIESNTFNQLGSLKSLSLAQNSITTLENNCFSGLDSIRELNLSGNSIVTVPDQTFSGFTRTQLITLDLSKNNLRNILPQTFADLRFLQQLDLSQNSITNIEEHVFVGLRSVRKLYLQTNDIMNIQTRTFAPLTNLDHLDLSENALNTFSGDVFGMTMPRMRKLFLKANNIQVIQPRSFEHVPMLDYLSLANNHINALPADLFLPLSNLRKLNIGHNRIEELDGVMFNYTTRIQDMIISFNVMTFFPDVSVDFNYLKRVSIEGNPWQCACLDDMFAFLELRKIDYRITGNRYFDGTKPICVVTPVEVCVKNIRLVREHHIVEHYEDAVATKLEQDLIFE